MSVGPRLVVARDQAHARPLVVQVVLLPLAEPVAHEPKLFTFLLAVVVARLRHRAGSGNESTSQNTRRARA